MSYFFDSSDQQGILQDKGMVNGDNPFTVMLWAKRQVTDVSRGVLFIGDSATDDAGLFAQSSGNTSQASFRYLTFFDGPDASKTAFSNNKTEQDMLVWHPVFFTYQPAINEFDITFIDTATTSSVNNPGYTPNRTTIGYWGDSSPSSYYTGWLAHLAIWDRVLDAGEIADLQSGKNPLDYPTGLISYVPFVAGLDDALGYYDNLQLVGTTPPVLSTDNPPVDRPNIITVWKWSGNDAAGNPVFDATFENLADGTTPGTIPTWIKINYAPPPGFGGGLVGGIVGGRQPGDSLLGKDQQGDLTGLTADLTGNLTGLGNDYDSYDYWP